MNKEVTIEIPQKAIFKLLNELHKLREVKVKVGCNSSIEEILRQAMCNRHNAIEEIIDGIKEVIPIDTNLEYVDKRWERANMNKESNKEYYKKHKREGED